MIKKTKEDYLRAIYHFQEDKKDTHQGINSISLSKYLEISKPTVSEMLRKMMKEKLVHITPYGKIKLTKKGLSESKTITKKHRIIEVFLAKILKINQKTIHKEAHRLEHAFSNNSINSISKLIKNIKRCPHGKPIP
ncbi:MAG: metal-dependent transcriptional regulator [Nanoarchaeota archaeon]|nr:metal-dependent transcriptional regulator [Nanoarchaeota archaeon]